MAKKYFERNVAVYDTDNNDFIIGEDMGKEDDGTWYIKEHPDIEPTEVKVNKNGDTGVIDVTSMLVDQKDDPRTLNMLDNIFKKTGDFTLKDVLPELVYKDIKEQSRNVDKLYKEDNSDGLFYVAHMLEKLNDADYKGYKFYNENEKDYSNEREAFEDFHRHHDDTTTTGKTIDEAGFEGFKDTAIREDTAKESIFKLVEQVKEESKGNAKEGTLFGVLTVSGKNYTPLDLIWVATIASGIKTWLKTGLSFKDSMKIANVKHPWLIVDARLYEGKLKEYRKEINNAIGDWVEAKKDLERFEKAFDVEDFTQLEAKVIGLQNDLKGITGKIQDNNTEMNEDKRKVAKYEKNIETAENMIERWKEQREKETDSKKIEKIDQKIDRFEKSIEATKKDIAERNERLEKNEKENSELNKDYREKKDEIEKTKKPHAIDKKIEKELEKAQEKVDNKEDELKKEVSKKEQLKNEKSELSKDKMEKQKTIESLNSKEEDNKEKVDSLEKKKDNYEKEKNKIEGKIDQTEKEIKDLSKEKEELNEKGEKDKAEQKQKEIDQKVEANLNRKSEISNVEAKQENVEKELSDIRKDPADESMKGEVDDLKKDIENIDKQVKKVDKELGKKDDRISSLENQKDNLIEQKTEVEKKAYPWKRIEARNEKGEKNTFYKFQQKANVKRNFKGFADDMKEQGREVEKLSDNLDAFEELYNYVVEEGNELDEEVLDKFMTVKELTEDAKGEIEESEAQLEYTDKKIQAEEGKSKVDKIASSGTERNYEKVKEMAGNLKVRVENLKDKLQNQEDKREKLNDAVSKHYKTKIDGLAKELKDLYKELENGDITFEEYENLADKKEDELKENSKEIKEKVGVNYEPRYEKAKDLNDIAERSTESSVESSTEKSSKVDDKDKDALGVDKESTDDETEKSSEGNVEDDNDNEEEEEDNSVEDDSEQIEDDDFEPTDAEILNEADALFQESQQEREKNKEQKNTEEKNENNNEKDESLASEDNESNENKQEEQTGNNDDKSVKEDTNNEKIDDSNEEASDSSGTTEDVQKLVEKFPEGKSKEYQVLLKEYKGALEENEKLKEKLYGENKVEDNENFVERFVDAVMFSIKDIKDPEERAGKIEGIIETIQERGEYDDFENSVVKRDVSDVVEKNVEVQTVDKNNETFEMRLGVEEKGTRLKSFNIENTYDGKDVKVQFDLRQLEKRDGSILYRSADAWAVSGKIEMTVDELIQKVKEHSNGIEGIELTDAEGNELNEKDVEKIKKGKEDFIAALVETIQDGNGISSEELQDLKDKFEGEQDEYERNEDASVEHKEDSDQDAANAVENAKNINDKTNERNERPQEKLQDRNERPDNSPDLLDDLDDDDVGI